MTPLWIGLLIAASAGHAQSPATPSPSAATTAAEGASESAAMARARRAAERPFRWIIESATGDRAKEAPAKPAPAPTAVAAPKAQAPRPAVRVTREGDEPSRNAVVEAAPAKAATPLATLQPPSQAPASTPALDRKDDEPRKPPAPQATAVAATAASAPPVAAMGASASAPVKRAAAPEAPPPAQVAEVEEPLVPISQSTPDIPRWLCENSACPRVLILRYTVQTDGSVSQAHVLTGSNTRLNRLATEAVLQWRYAPLKASREAQISLIMNNY